MISTVINSLISRFVILVSKKEKEKKKKKKSRNYERRGS